MPRDPKARPIRIKDSATDGGYHFVNQPGLGPGAYRDVVWSDGTVERYWVPLRSPEQIAEQGTLPPTAGIMIGEQEPDYDMAVKWETNQPTERTPEARARDAQVVAKGEREEREAAELERQKKANFEAYGRAETDEQKRDREQKERTEARQDATAKQTAAQQEAANRLAEARLGLDVTKYEDERGKPNFLSQAGTDNPFITAYNPVTGTIQQTNNPNYDRVKVEAERMRNMLTTQIQARQVTLDEAKMQYQQWFDSNVKTPLMLAQEARDKAAEQRQALEAEEKRRQFAADFGLRKGELGQRAGQMMISAEQSLLPYRAGPTESAEMSSAINSLAAGGSMANNASAGVNFTPGAFQFDAPDFKKIAKSAAKQALSGLTEYRPAEGEFQTADYSGVPAVNAGGAPSIPSGYGDFQSIIDNLKSTYTFGGGQGG